MRKGSAWTRKAWSHLQEPSSAVKIKVTGILETSGCQFFLLLIFKWPKKSNSSILTRKNMETQTAKGVKMTKVTTEH